jgi:uncharacterized membrane protein
MGKSRLEAFSDGVIAIILTIMVLDLYVAAIAATVWSEWIAQAIYVSVALLWLVPDRRIEQALRQRET